MVGTRVWKKEGKKERDKRQLVVRRKKWGEIDSGRGYLLRDSEGRGKRKTDSMNGCRDPEHCSHDRDEGALAGQEQWECR